MLDAVRGARFVLAFVLLARVSHADEQSGAAREDPRRAQAADALPLELTWSAPPGCATADDVRHELGRIARARPGRTLPRVSADGRIERSGEAYRLTLHTVQNGVHGERSLVAKECRSLEREVTLVLALSFGEGVELVDDSAPDESNGAGSTNPGSGNGATPANAGTPANDTTNPASTNPSATGTPPGASTTPETPPKTSNATSPPPPSPAPSPTHDAGSGRIASSNSASGLHAGAFAGGGVLFGALPSPAAFVFAGADVSSGRFDVEPRFVWIPGVDQALPRDVHARYDGFGGSLAGCVGVPPLDAMFAACVAFEAIALRGRSSGASEAGESVAPFFAAAPAVRWQWPARGFVALRLEAALHVALNEPHFVVVGLGEAYSVPRLAPSVGGALLFRPGR
jgi:hypothetical protein